MSPRPGQKSSGMPEIDFPPPPSDLPSEDSIPLPSSPALNSPLPASPSLQNRFLKYREQSPDSCDSNKSLPESTKQSAFSPAPSPLPAPSPSPRRVPSPLRGPSPLPAPSQSQKLVAEMMSTSHRSTSPQPKMDANPASQLGNKTSPPPHTQCL